MWGISESGLRDFLHLAHLVLWPLALFIFSAIVLRKMLRGSSGSRISSKSATGIGPIPEEAINRLFPLITHRTGIQEQPRWSK